MSLDELRKEIDGIDKELVALLNKRADNANQIGDLKVQAKMPVQDANREKEVVDKIKGLNSGPLSDESMELIYRQIITACLEVQNDKFPQDG